jgi:hypothetical protein
MLRLRLLLAISLILTASAALADPPAKVARLKYTSGEVSFRPAGLDDWAPASINRVVIGGDELWTDESSRAELHFGSAAIRLGERTNVGVLSLDDDGLQLRLTSGTLNLRIRRLGPDETVEIDAPNASLTLWRAGSYRIDVSPDGDRTYVVVHDGDLEATVTGSAFSVHSHETATIVGTGDDVSNSVNAAGPNDSFDRWCSNRDRRDDLAAASAHVPRDLVGYEDLAEYGTWENVPAYGWVWAPRAVAAAWAPYHNGHWAWIEPWGWTWVDDAPWGFAPFHYGRWAHLGVRWVWVPGEVVRPVYAPALVAWVGGNRWSASVTFGAGGGVGWFPLAPREVYVPAYRVAPAYVRDINRGVAPVTNININVNVTNVHYANQTVPGAMTAVSREAFATARPVAQVAVRVPREAVVSAQVSGPVAPVAPRPQAVLGHASVATNVVRPPRGILARRVVARVAPPSPPAPFSAQTTLLAQHPGTPLATEEIRSIRASSPQVTPVVRPVAKSGFIPRAEAARQHAVAAPPQPIYPTTTAAPAINTRTTAKPAQPVERPRVEDHRRPAVITGTAPATDTQSNVITTTAKPAQPVERPRVEDRRRPVVTTNASAVDTESNVVTTTAKPAQPRVEQPTTEDHRRQAAKPQVVKPEEKNGEPKKKDDAKKSDKKDEKKKEDEKKKDQQQ